MQVFAKAYVKEFNTRRYGRNLFLLKTPVTILYKFWKFHHSKILSLENSSKNNQLNIIFQTPGIGKTVFKLNLL